MPAGTCLSCHKGISFTTQGPDGNAWPNLAGKHAKHLALSTFTRTTPALPAPMSTSAYPKCAACHSGSVPGDATNTHYSNASKTTVPPVTSGPASVKIDVAFNAKTGTAGTTPSTSAFTCSNISCHGGQVTPGWQTGTLPTDAVDPTTNCKSCHKMAKTATQYNDATGTHNQNSYHLGAACRVCHDMSTANTKSGAVNHWKYLDTPSVVIVAPDQLSSDTVKFFLGSSASTINGDYTDSGSSYTASATIGNGNCTITCHTPAKSFSHSADKWTK
jgi:predicted CxxxxCH...CXXCH cytochrome family protein